MMATVPHVTSGSGLRKFQADGFLFDRAYTINSNFIRILDTFLPLYKALYPKKNRDLHIECLENLSFLKQKP